MRVTVKVPKLGLTIEEVTLASWEQEVGAPVQADDIIAVLEADKTSYELAAPTAGTLTEKLAEPGDVLPVGAVVAVIQR